MILHIYVFDYGYLPTQDAVQIKIHIVAGNHVSLEQDYDSEQDEKVRSGHWRNSLDEVINHSKC